MKNVENEHLRGNLKWLGMLATVRAAAVIADMEPDKRAEFREKAETDVDLGMFIHALKDAHQSLLELSTLTTVVYENLTGADEEEPENDSH